MEQLIIRVIDGDNKPLLGEEFSKRDHRDGIMKYYQLHEVANELRCYGAHTEKGAVYWTDITYNLKQVEPST
jgi:hypothetical protein